MNRHGLDAGYYQSLHDTNPAFQNNNWLTQDLTLLRQWGGQSLLELGCGNGRFLQLAAEHWPRVVGVDWARSPFIEQTIASRPGISFVQADILEWTPDGRFDLVVSADFLEHLPPDKLGDILKRIHGFGRRHYHRIACYDDGHSHLSIHPPRRWIELFEVAAPGCYRLLSCDPRKGDKSKLVITIGTD